MKVRLLFLSVAAAAAASFVGAGWVLGP